MSSKLKSNKLDAALSSSGWKSVDLSQFRSFNNQSMNGLLEFEEIDASEFFGKSKAPKIITLQGGEKKLAKKKALQEEEESKAKAAAEIVETEVSEQPKKKAKKATTDAPTETKAENQPSKQSNKPAVDTKTSAPSKPAVVESQPTAPAAVQKKSEKSKSVKSAKSDKSDKSDKAVVVKSKAPAPVIDEEQAKIQAKIEKSKAKKQKQKDKRALRRQEEEAVMKSTEEAEDVEVDEADVRKAMAGWAQYHLSIPVLVALQKLKFHEPTPIQSAVLPKAIRSKANIIGCAQTGSGKTLAFGIPIIERLMFDYEKELDMSHLCALILTPTRELAIQVSEHLKAIAVYTPIKVMALVGGISVQKQERLLAKRPQVVVATPGRLWEMISTGKEHLTDLSGLRFLVLDEADRMIETGHFPEVSSILQHVNSFGKSDIEVDNPDKLLPTEEDAARLRRMMKREAWKPRSMREAEKQAEGSEDDAQSDDDQDVEHDSDEEQDEGEEQEELDSEADEDMDSEHDSENDDGEVVEMSEDSAEADSQLEFWQIASLPFVRQLRYLGVESEEAYKNLDISERKHIDRKLAKAVRFAARKEKKDIAGPNAEPAQFQRQVLLFSATLTMGATGRRSAEQNARALKREERLANASKSKQAAAADAGNGSALDALIKRIEFNSPPIVVDLSIATQVATTVEEAMVQAVNEEKDYYLYYFCSRFPGRTVVFVNAISCLRRVLSILSLLKLPAFGLHANMQQKQRLKNLERFKSQENAILVATDVAARGLDIPLVQHVLHYQLPRTSEVYVHRAGRAGRAQAHGYSVAMVGPDEVKDYRKICEVLNKSSGIPPLQVDMAWMASCRARVTAARKLDKELNDVRKDHSKEDWFRRHADEAEMMFGDQEDDDDTRAGQERRAAKVRKQALIREFQSHLDHLMSRPLLPKGASRSFVTISAADAAGMDINTRLAILEGAKIGSARDDFDKSKETQQQRQRQGIASVGQKLLGKKRKAPQSQ